MYQKIFGKMKKLQTKIVLSMALMAVGIGLLVGVFGSMVTRYSTEEALKETLIEASELAALSAERSMDIHKGIIEYLAHDDALTSSRSSWQDKHTFLRRCAQDLGYLDAYIFDVDGTDHISGYQVADMDYFIYPMQGETYVSVPYPKYGTEGMYIVVSTPVYTGNQISAVICLSIDQMVFQGIVESLVIGESKNNLVYILDKDGTVVASMDYEAVIARQNNLSGTEEQIAQANPAQVEIEKNMISGKSGVEKWTNGKVEYLQCYAPIFGSDNWSLAVAVELDEYMGTADNSIILLIGIVALLMILSGLFALYIGKSIAAPIVDCSQRLQLLAEGDLKSPLASAVGNDEVAALTTSTGILINSFSDIVDEMDIILSNIADGDLSGQISSNDYPGDFASIKNNLRVIDQKLNHTIGNIQIAAEHVYNGSQQVSDGAQSLAQGATEQASSIEQLSATITEVSGLVKRTAENAEIANKTSADAESRLMDCNRQMQNLVSAMNDINEKSEEISKIIKVIEDISFQTNILALNAAVEAARAGAAGKGFAVVADEVRSLAGKSAEASKSTSALIESSVMSVQNGMKILHQTEESLGEVVTASRRSAQLVSEISSNSNEQTSAISQITDAVEQIAGVVHLTSATSEQSAATSEALSRQAEDLKQAVDQFRLKDHSEF